MTKRGVGGGAPRPSPLRLAPLSSATTAALFPTRHRDPPSSDRHNNYRRPDPYPPTLTRGGPTNGVRSVLPALETPNGAQLGFLAGVVRVCRLDLRGRPSAADESSRAEASYDGPASALLGHPRPSSLSISRIRHSASAVLRLGEAAAEPGPRCSGGLDRVEPERKRVITTGGDELPYDTLVLALRAHPSGNGTRGDRPGKEVASLAPNTPSSPVSRP